jgi:hypothetical protein
VGTAEHSEPTMASESPEQDDSDEDEWPTPSPPRRRRVEPIERSLPIALSDPVLAYDIGRLSNQLQYDLVRYWFSYNEPEYGRRVRRAATELVRRFRLVLPDLESREGFENKVEHVTRGLLGRYMHPDFSDPVGEMLEDYNDPRRMRPYEIEDPDGERPSIRDDFARVVLEAMAEIEGEIWGGLGERERLLFRIGQAVDRGIRPLGIELLIIQEDSDANAGKGLTNFEYGRYDIIARDPGDRPLSEEWLERLTDLLREAGVPEREIEGFDRLFLTPDTGPCGLVEAIVARVRELLTTPIGGSPGDVRASGRGADPGRRGDFEGEDVRIRPEVEDASRSVPDRSAAVDLEPAGFEVPTPPMPETRPSPFGLRFDDDQLTLTREGIPKTVRFDGSLLAWSMMKALSTRWNATVREDRWKAIWRDCGEATPKPAAVSELVSQLRKLIEPIGLTIPRKRGPAGYRLSYPANEAGDQEGLAPDNQR